MSEQRTQLPEILTAGVQEAFADLSANPSVEQVIDILQSSSAIELLGQTQADIAALDGCFTPSGPGGFYRSDVARSSAGRLKLHIFPSLEICDGDTGPHSHSTEVLSFVYAGVIQNVTYGFARHPDGDMRAEAFSAPAHQSRRVVPLGSGYLSEAQQELVANGVYAVRHGEIHTSATMSEYAMTLCFFGKPISPGVRYEPRSARPSAPPERSMVFRPKDIVR